MLFKKHARYSSNYHRLHNPSTNSQMSKGGCYSNKNWPATAAIVIGFTILQRIHRCPRADALKKILACYSSNFPRLHNPPTSSQMTKSGWFKKKMPATAAIFLDFTIIQRIHKCPRADGIIKHTRYSSNYARLHNLPTNSQMPKSGCS